MDSFNVSARIGQQKYILKQILDYSLLTNPDCPRNQKV